MKIPRILAESELPRPAPVVRPRAMLWATLRTRAGAAYSRLSEKLRAWLVIDLLREPILAEVSIHVLRTGGHKAMLSKLDSQADADRVVQALLYTTLEVAKGHGIGIAWDALKQLYPNPGEKR